MVGRTDEQARLKALIDAARDGRSGALLLHGPPGIGKTELLRFAVDPKFSRTPQNVERLQLALGKYLGTHVKLEFADGAPPVETPSQNGQRRTAEALEAARRSLDDDPAVLEMKSRFGATLHAETVRPTEQ